MKKEEYDTLVKKKRGEGKSYKQANKEIDDLVEARIVFKENQKVIRHLTKKVETLKEENSKLKQKNLTQGLLDHVKIEEDLKKVEEKNTHVASINDLNRVIRILRMEKEPRTVTDLRDLCCSNTSKVNPCLNFLVKNNLIKKENLNGSTKYSSL